MLGSILKGIGSTLNPVAGLVSGGAAMLGGLLTNASNRDLARQQMAFQERMSSTAMERSAADMRAAGFNPLLGFDNPASSPTGSLATMANAVGEGVASGRQVGQVSEQVEAIRAAAARDRESAELLRAQTGLASAQTRSVEATTALNVAREVTERARPPQVGQATETDRIRARALDAQEHLSRAGIYVAREREANLRADRPRIEGEAMATANFGSRGTDLRGLGSQLEAIIQRIRREID